MNGHTRIPRAPVGDDLEADAVDRWACRRSPDCRKKPCALSIRRARLRRLHTAHPRGWR